MGSVNKQALSKLNANQISEKWVSFLKECSAFGEDVTYLTEKVTGGTFDAVADKVSGGSTTSVSTTFSKASLDAPISFSESGVDTGGGKTGVVFGHKLGGLIIGETRVTRFTEGVPINTAATYRISGMDWKVVRLVDSYSVGKKVFWNLVQLAKA